MILPRSIQSSTTADPHIASLVERLEIAEAVRTKTTRPDSDIVSELVAEGRVELGLVVILRS